MPNFLEQLAAEWYEYRGYFVRRNVLVGKRSAGGHEGELDVVAFNPAKQSLVHIECSMDADSWAERERRFSQKFRMGRKYIQDLFQGFDSLPQIEPIALLAMGSSKNHVTVGGGRVVMVGELLQDIRQKIPSSFTSAIVPEQFVILRTLQFAAESWPSH